MGIPEEEREKRTEKILEEIMTKTVSKLMKCMSLQIQEAQ